MDDEGFKQWSLFLEALLDNIAVECRCSTGDLIAISQGRFLWNAIQFSDKILDLFSGPFRDGINQVLIDRFAEYKGALGDCIGSNTHELAAIVLHNLCGNARRREGFPPDESTHWKKLSASEKQVLQDVEESLNKQSLDLCKLATQVRLERQAVYSKTTQSLERHAEETVGQKTINEKPIPDAEFLPFGLQRCDVPQSLKREGFKQAVTIKNADHWKLMEALMEAFPHAVSEHKLRRIFQGPNDRDNYSRALKNSIVTIGLTVEKWVLTAMRE